jgi:hypothetical protein
LVKYSGYFAKRIEGLKITYTPIIMKTDVDHYYLSGRLDELVRDAQLRRHFGAITGALMERILRYLLGNQYVMSKVIGFHRAWRVNFGTGMGLIHSGELADLIFLQQGRIHHARTKTKSLASHGIVHYSHFRDDILYVGQDALASVKFLYEMRRHGEYFKISQENISIKEGFSGY